jgi:hypothetical protein
MSEELLEADEAVGLALAVALEHTILELFPAVKDGTTFFSVSGTNALAYLTLIVCP